MTDEDRRALGMARRLAFQNLATGVPAERICAALGLTQLELDQMRRFVARKITEHLVLRRQPPIACDDVRTMRANRVKLLGVLARIGDLDLSTELVLGRITVQVLDHPEMVQGASRKMAEAYSR